MTPTSRLGEIVVLDPTVTPVDAGIGHVPAPAAMIRGVVGVLDAGLGRFTELVLPAIPAHQMSQNIEHELFVSHYSSSFGLSA